MKKIGITGGIGSGKSLVCSIFKTLGIAVYNADIRAKELLDKHPLVVQQVTEAFGSEIYVHGTANRKLLASKVFHHPEELKKLNDIIHPAVFSDFEDWANLHRNEPYIIKEAAIMLETGAHKQLDKVVLVYAPDEIRIIRTMQRDNADRNDVLARMKNQMDEKTKMKMCDHIIFNDESRSLIRQVLELHHLFLTKL